jgi:hypothetical protein
MTPNDIVTLAKILGEKGLLLPAPAAPGIPPPATDRIYQSLVVDLDQAIIEAAGAQSVDIYADTLVVRDGIRVQIGNAPQRLSIIARRIIQEGTGQIALAHDGEAPLSSVRILTGKLEGDFGVVSHRNMSSTPYDLTALAEVSERPHYTVFYWRDGAPSITRSEVPAGLLQLGRPLYNTLATSFDLCAGAIGAPNNERIALAHAMLAWIARFAGLGADLASIGRIAEAVRAILPVTRDNELVYPIPPRTAASYKQLAHSRKELSKTTGLDIKFLEMTGTVADIARQFASINIDRDRIEAKLIEDQLKELDMRRQTIKMAIDRVADDINNQKFNADLENIRFGLALKLDSIDKIVKATFDIVVATISLVSSIASIAMGVPPLPQGGTHTDIKGITGLNEAFKGVNPAGADNLTIVKTLFALPFTFAWEHGSDHKDSIKELTEASVAIKKAGAAILDNVMSPAGADEMTRTVGEAIRAIAGKPNPIEAKAAWDGIELDVVNGLQLVIDGDFSGEVKQAAINYKTLMQKICIQGGVLSEYQAAGDAVDRERGTLILQRLAQIAKQAELAKLQTGLTDRSSLTERIKAEVMLRQQTASRAFFEACYGFQRANFFETYTAATLVHPEVLPDPSLMEASYSNMETDHENALQIIGRKQVNFDREILIDDPDQMARLRKGNLTLSIGLNHPLLAKLSHVRLTSVQAWLEATPPLTGRVALELCNGEICQDRIDGGRTIELFGWVQSFPFEYRGDVVEISRTLNDVRIPPFSNWTVGISSPDSLPIIVALRLRLTGYAFQ